MSWLFSKRNNPPSFDGKIEVFSRHCIASDASAHKKRPAFFSHEICYQNLIKTIDRTKANLTLILDAAKGSKQDHYLANEPCIEIQEGTEAKAFLRLLEHVAKLDLHPGTILYFVEDDYFHKPGWVDVLKEGFQVPEADYVTLYDHNDKYSPLYKGMKSKIFTTPHCHWRTVPSTTQTFACRFQTLLEDLFFHKKYSQNRKISADHAKFLRLKRRGRVLISSMPGWCTHAEPEFASPCVDWETVLKR
jgi:hypothetical protein